MEFVLAGSQVCIKGNILLLNIIMAIRLKSGMLKQEHGIRSN